MKMQILAGVALLLACGAASAGEHEGMGEGMHCKMMGHDKMDAAERKDMMDKMFAKLDANHDGSIDRGEFDKHQEAMMGAEPEGERPEAHEHDEQHK